MIRNNVENYLNGLDLDSYKQNNPEMGKLLDNLKKSEISRENLKGMGEGIRPILDITGAMRADFTNVEISHGSEQFNYAFTQPLDKEWVHIQPDGKVDIIKGEQELLKTFNNIKEKGRNIPPNPNWGWKINDEGKYEIDPELKEQNKKVDQLMMKKSSKGTEQDKKIQEILDNRLDLGLAASRKDPKLSDKEQRNKIETLRVSLNTKLREYDIKYNPQKQDLVTNANREYIQLQDNIESFSDKDKAAIKIYNKLYPNDLKIINDKLNSLSPEAQKRAKEIINALEAGSENSQKNLQNPITNIAKQQNNRKTIQVR